MRDPRSLRELGLLEVARLYGIVQAPRPGPSQLAIDSVATDRSHPPSSEANDAPGPTAAVVAIRAGDSHGAWLWVFDRGAPLSNAEAKLLDAMLAAIDCAPEGEAAPFDPELTGAAPRMIVALGDAAAESLLREGRPAMALRGAVHRYREIPVVVTCAPAHLLRTPADKAKAWEDLLFARRTLAAS